MNKQKHKMVGLLGGMGPAASARVYSKIVTISQKKYNAEEDTDYPPMMIYNLTLDGFNETGFVDKSIVKEQLINGVKKLENAGVDFIVIACNTVHYFYNEMQEAVSVLILNLPEETAQRVRDDGSKKVGLLTSRSTRELKLYTNAFRKYGIETVEATEEEQDILDKVILHAMSGSQTDFDLDSLKKVISRMFKDGADSIVLGCTELPLVLTQKDVDITVYDTITITAEKALEESKRKV